MDSETPQGWKIKRIAGDFVIIMATTLMLLAVLEVALRLLSPESTDIYGHNDIFGMQINPNVVGKFQRPAWHGGEEILWRTNSSGYRGAELTSEPGIRVAVYGDSNVFAMFSQHSETLTQQLGKKLTDATGQDIEVVNAGTVGFGPDQNLLRFEHEADYLEPDLVLFHVFADNDFGDIIRNRLFDLDGPRLVR